MPWMLIGGLVAAVVAYELFFGKVTVKVTTREARGPSARPDKAVPLSSGASRAVVDPSKAPERELGGSADNLTRGG